MGSTPAFANRVRARYDTLDGLLAAGELVQAITSHAGWGHLLAFIDAEIAEIDRGMDGQREPLSQAQYAMRHGRRDGLRSLETYAQTIVRVAEDALAKQRAMNEGIAESVPQEIV